MMKKLLRMNSLSPYMKQLLSDVLFALALVGFAGGIYYHYLLIKEIPYKVDCRQLIGGWHPDVPAKVADECRKQLKERNNANER